MSSLVLLCIILTLREFKFMSLNSQYGRYISIYSMILHCIWNMLIFISLFNSSALTMTEEFPLALPTTLIFVYVLIFQINMFSHIWKSRNEELILSQVTQETIRSRLFHFNCWIYVVVICAIIILTNIRLNALFFGIFASIFWLPQIIENFINVRSKAPSMLYIFGTTLEQLFTPVLSSLLCSFIY